MTKSRLEELKSRGHGDCLEAIKLEPDDDLRIEKLKRYVSTRPDGKMLRRAERLLAKETTDSN